MMSNDLLPCPFCGGHAEIRPRKVHHKDWFGKDYRMFYRVRCKNCGASVGRIAACEYHRDERTGEEWGAVIDWNTRAERTCEIVDFIEHVLMDEPDIVELSCGHDMMVFGEEMAPSYCPECGAKVVDNG